MSRVMGSPSLGVPDDVLTPELLSRRNADGGWGASPGAASNAECTALTVAALLSYPDPTADVKSARDAGVRWLLERQSPDGSWRYHAEGPETTWPTPIALLALRSRGGADASVERGVAWLLEVRGESYPWWLRLRDFFRRERVIELDSTLEGWPWIAGTFAWVEPTAWALLALKAAPREPAPRALRARIREAEDMLLDRACVDGGWNYGNRRVLGEELDPYPDTTALALMGLRGRTAPQVDSGFRALDRLLDEYASGLSLALALLSRRCWAHDAADLPTRIRTRYAETGFLQDNRTLALAVLALAPHISWLGDRSHG